MKQFRSILIASISFSVIAVFMWGLAIGWSATHECATAMPLDRAGAVAASVLAGVWWALLLLLRAERDRVILLRTLAGAVQDRATGEQRALRAVSSR